jgi:hypothetical protein
MNSNWNANTNVLLTTLLVTSLMPLCLNATVLTFNGTSGSIDQTYGDRVTSLTMGAHGYGQMGEGFTPNVVVDYDPSGGAAWTWPGAYGDLPGPVLFESVDTAKLQIKLTADPGYRVTLQSWDMATYGTIFHPDGETINGVTVYDAGGTPLFSQTNVYVPISTHISFETFPTPLVDTMLILEIDARNVTAAFGNEDIGVDNIRFSQVPEPGNISLAAVAIGASLIAARRRRRDA